MVGQQERNDEMDFLDDELSSWPSSVREEGGWVRFTEEQPSKRLPAQDREGEKTPSRRSDDDWFLGAYRRYHAEGESKSKGKDKLQVPPQGEAQPQDKAQKVAQKASPKPPVITQRQPQDKRQADPNFDELDLLLPYEEQPTVAMFTRRPQQPQRSDSTREELYREAQRRGIEGRSKMNKRQLALALGDTAQKP